MSPKRPLAPPCRSSFLGGVLLGLAVALTMGPGPARAQFDDCARRTPSNASIILPADLEVIVDGRALRRVEVAVVAPGGACVGSARWAGEAAALAAWGTDGDAAAPSLPDVVSPGAVLAPGDTMRVHLLDPAAGTRYTDADSRVELTFRADAPYLRTEPRYVPNGIYVLDRIHVHQELAGRN